MDLEARVARSAHRLLVLLKCVDAPKSVVDFELELLCKTVGGLVGPDRVRRWMDELTNRECAAFTEPQTTCPTCRGCGRCESGQCAHCHGLGAI